ncbi:hypothetical protein Cantr_05588 [Candida viswanathii]|uniref:Uncharacterized protein n=1 Tax=Candida viswanathii TaxID=5486 RepID=A0A367XPW2_9ASCO|nr:hypothetical protein Cantr_05588 [Candida viswanathii]
MVSLVNFLIDIPTFYVPLILVLKELTRKVAFSYTSYKCFLNYWVYYRGLDFIYATWFSRLPFVYYAFQVFLIWLFYCGDNNLRLANHVLLMWFLNLEVLNAIEERVVNVAVNAAVPNFVDLSYQVYLCGKTYSRSVDYASEFRWPRVFYEPTTAAAPIVRVVARIISCLVGCDDALSTSAVPRSSTRVAASVPCAPVAASVPCAPVATPVPRPDVAAPVGIRGSARAAVPSIPRVATPVVIAAARATAGSGPGSPPRRRRLTGSRVRPPRVETIIETRDPTAIPSSFRPRQSTRSRSSPTSSPTESGTRQFSRNPIHYRTPSPPYPVGEVVNLVSTPISTTRITNQPRTIRRSTSISLPRLSQPPRAQPRQRSGSDGNNDGSAGTDAGRRPRIREMPNLTSRNGRESVGGMVFYNNGDSWRSY